MGVILSRHNLAVKMAAKADEIVRQRSMIGELLEENERLRERISELSAACQDNYITCACGTIGYCEAGSMCGTGG